MIINPYIFGKAKAVNGYLYNGNSATNMVLPNSWVIPDKSDLDNLIAAVTDGGDLKETGFVRWDSPNTGADNSSGFSAFGSGFRADLFYSILNRGQFWSSESGGSGNWYFYLSHDDSLINLASNIGNLTGSSLRAKYEGAGTPSNFVDYNGNIYDVVQIGGVWWTKQNLKTTYLNSGTQLTKVTSQVTWDATTTQNYYCAYDNNEQYV